MPRIACTFFCALTVVQALLIQKPLRTDAVTGFIGSATCAWCHKTQAEKQSASSMARAAFRPQFHPLFHRFRNQEARTPTRDQRGRTVAPRELRNTARAAPVGRPRKKSPGGR